MNKVPADELAAALEAKRRFAFLLPPKEGFDLTFVVACEELAVALAHNEALPAGPLRAVVRKIGAQEFKALAQRLGPGGRAPIEVSTTARRVRKPKTAEMRRQWSQLDLWGCMVIAAVEQKSNLYEAREEAAQALGWDATGAKTLENRWNDLKRKCVQRRYGPQHPISGKIYPLAALNGRPGVRPKNSRKKALPQ